MKSVLCRRPVVVIDWSDTNIEIIHPQLAVLVVSKQLSAGKRHMDVGALCYSTRRKKNNPVEISSFVDLATFEPERVPVAIELIEYLRGVANGNSAFSIFQKFNLFFDWIDSQQCAYAFNDVTSLKKNYRDYTQHLLHRINISGINGKPIRRETAGQYQAAARTVVMLATGLSDPTVKASAPYIPVKRDQTRHIDRKLPDADTQARTFAALVNFIEESHRILVHGEAFPLRLLSPNHDTFYFYSETIDSKKSKSANFSVASMLNSSPSFPTWKEVKAYFSIAEESRPTATSRGIYDNASSRYRKNNENLRSHLRQKIGTHAVVAGMIAFIAATGCNLSVATNLEVDTLELVPTSQGNRFSGTKGRANGKTVTPEFGARFLPVFKKYLDLRKWVLNGVESMLIFPFASPRFGIIPLDSNQISGTKTLFAKSLPGTAWVTSSQWRKNVSYQYIKISDGDMVLASEKLGNTEATLRQSYGRPAFEDFANEMTNFFELMHQAAVDRTRSVACIPVRIVDDDSSETATGIGSCEKAPKSTPKLALGFTEQAPSPACGAPETCLFCEFYAVHADEQDIRRLLSLRYLILAIKDKQPFDHWQIKFGPSLHRIDEVLSAIKTIDASIEPIINRVRDEVESGALDAFWAIHFDTLIIVGMVS